MDLSPMAGIGVVNHLLPGEPEETWQPAWPA